MVEAADSPTESGGLIDFTKKSRGVSRMTIETGKAGSIELRPDGTVEGIWHSHPTQNRAKTLDRRAEQYRQQSPSPVDVLEMLSYHETVGDSFISTPDVANIPDDGLIVHYSTTPKTPPRTKQLEKNLWADYNAINRAAVRRHPDSVRKQMKWADREWMNLLRHKYHIYLRTIPPAEYRKGVTLYLKEVKG